MCIGSLDSAGTWVLFVDVQKTAFLWFDLFLRISNVRKITLVSEFQVYVEKVHFILFFYLIHSLIIAFYQNIVDESIFYTYLSCCVYGC